MGLMTRKSVLLWLAVSCGTVALGSILASGFKNALRRAEAGQMRQHPHLPGNAFSMTSAPAVDDPAGGTTIRFELVNRTRDVLWLRTVGGEVHASAAREQESYLQPLEAAPEGQRAPRGVIQLAPGDGASGSCRFLGRRSLARQVKVYIMLGAYRSSADAEAGSNACIWIGPPITLSK
jgi:hypothetical protein